MTPEELREYEDYVDMFATDGWKLYVKNMEGSRQDNLNAAPDNATTNDMWQYCRGVLAQMQATIGFEMYVLLVHEQAMEEEKQSESDDEDSYNPNE